MDVLGNGLGPAELGASSLCSMVAFPVEIYQSPLLDLTVPTLGIELVPAKPGHFPMVQLPRWAIEVLAGTQTTPMVSNAGSNIAHTNFYASQSSPSNANVNAAVPPTTLLGVTTQSDVQKIANAPIIMDVTAGAQGTGGFMLKGKFWVAVMWISILSP